VNLLVVTSLRSRRASLLSALLHVTSRLLTTTRACVRGVSFSEVLASHLWSCRRHLPDGFSRKAWHAGTVAD
jgi:hypothetical protein